MSVGITVSLNFYAIFLSFKMSCMKPQRSTMSQNVFSDFNIGELEGALSLSSTVSNNLI